MCIWKLPVISTIGIIIYNSIYFLSTQFSMLKNNQSIDELLDYIHPVKAISYTNQSIITRDECILIYHVIFDDRKIEKFSIALELII